MCSPPTSASRPTRRSSVLELHDVHAHYGSSHVLHGVSLNVSAGEAVALMGRNGVGKTTTIRTIMGFLPASG
ncbi:ATP-binding cassette domain-containing protein, partial [Escherichia coli]|nr:ATP-binding cassette domain-containing protein [Escherichia coli]